MKLNWNFLGGVCVGKWGGGGWVQNKRPSLGEYGYFLDLHNRRTVFGLHCSTKVIGLLIPKKMYLLLWWF